MIWSKIKKAINSTLGTSGFKPLDEIITDSFQAVVDKQNELKGALESGDNNFIVEFAKSSANIEVGSYVGTGTYGSRNPNTLSFAFAPKVVFISRSNGAIYAEEATLVFGSGSSYVIMGSDTIKLALNWEVNGVGWYGTSLPAALEASGQLNANNATYRYVAIG